MIDPTHDNHGTDEYRAYREAQADFLKTYVNPPKGLDLISKWGAYILVIALILAITAALLGFTVLVVRWVILILVGVFT